MRKNLKAAIIVAGVLSAFSIPAGSANEISSFADLQGAMTSGGSHNVNANIDMTDAITNTGSNALSGTAVNTTIDISNNGTTSAFTNQGELTINNINFTGGENAEAYVINNLTGGTVNFQGDIKFENNGGFEYNAIANAVGGVIKSDESSNLTFTTNQAGIVPVIDNYGELNLAGKNTFSENSSMAGAIGNSHTGTANIGKDAVFNNNEGEMGGAIYNQGEFTVQEGAEFSTNISTMGGGAIYNSKSNDNGVTTVPDMNVDSATFTGNYVETSATQTGGSTSGDMGSGFATGGAIYNNQAQVTVSNSTFDGNQAISHFDSDNPSSAGIGGQAQGGAIYSVDGTVTINGGENAVFKNNAATSDGTGRKNTQGGAIYGKNSTINLDSTTGNIVFESSNSADLGKDLYLDGTTVANINGTNSDYYVEFTGDNSIRGSIESEILKSGDGGLKLSNGDFSTYEGQFTQTGGKTELNDATLFANSDIQGGQLSLNGASNISSTGNFKANNSTIAFADNSNTSSILGAMSANDNVKNNDLVISNDASQPTLTVDTDISVGTDETGNSLTINDNVNYSGDITVTDGTVNANAENADLTISGALSNNGTLNINSSAGQKVIQSGSVTGTGTISKTGEGDYTVTSDGSGFSGQFTQSAGSTIFDGAGSKTYQNITINDGGLTITNGAQAQTGNITINNSSSQFTVSGSGTVIEDTVNLALGGVTNVSAGAEINLNTGDSLSGVFTNDGGVVNINNFTNKTGSYTQNTGETTVTGNFAINNDADSITGGKLNIGTDAKTGTVNQSAGTISAGAEVDITANGTLNISGGSTSLNTGDKWEGTVNLSGGSLSVSDITNGGKLDATGGNLTLDSTGTLNIGTGSQITNAVNADLSGKVNIDGGSVSLNTGDTWAGDTTLTSGSLTVNNITNSGKLDATGGNLTLGSTGTLNIGTGSQITDAVNANLSGKVNIDGGSVSLNTGDTWAGDTTLSSGSLTVNNITNSGKLDATGGNLTLGSTGTLNIGTGSQITDAVNADLSGKVNINGGSVSLNTGDTWAGDTTLSSGSLTVNNITNSGKLNATGGDLTLGSSGTLNIGTGSQIAAAVNADLSGKVDIDGGSVSLNTGDTWSGDTTLTSGSLTVNDISNSGKLDATGGNLTLGSTGTLNIGTGSQVTDAVKANIGGSVYIDGGSVSLNSGDTWTGKISLSNGSLTVNDITNSGTLDATGGDLTLGATGTLNIGTGSQIANAVNADLSGKVNINGGSVFVNTGDNWSGDTTLSSGSLTVSDNTNGGKLNATGGNLTLDSTGTLNIGAGSAIAGAVKAEINGNVDITNGGSVTLNQGDTLGGTIGLGDGGIFTVDGIALDASGGKVTQTGGALNINNGAKFTTDNSLTGGTVTVNSSSELELSNTGNIDITSTISSADGTSKITQSGSGTTTYANDVSSFVGQYVQTDGVAEFSNAFFGGNSTLENGTINLNEGSSMVNSAVLALGNTASVNISVADGDNKNFNNFTDIAGMTSPSGAVINAGGDGTMILSGDNSGYTGQFIYNGKILEVAENTKLFGTDSITDIQSGEMNINNYVSTSEGSTLKIASGANVNINNSTGIFDLKSDLEGDGDINKNQDGDLIFSGDHSQFNGNTNINSSGNITFVNGMFGNLNFNDVEGKTIGIIADNIQGAINQTKNATVSYTTINDIDLIFNNEVNVSAGTFNAIAKAGRDVYFNDDVEVTGGTMGVYGNNANFESSAVVENASLYSFAQSTKFNELGIDKGNLIIANNGFSVANTMASTGTVDIMNGVIANNTIGGDFYTIGGETSNFKIDISPRNKTSDTTTIDGSILNYGTLQGTINISDFQFIGKAPIDRNIGLTLFKTSNPIDDNVLFSATNKEIFTPIGYYRLFSMGGGDFNAKLVRYNPQVFRGQVATVANYANQLAINNVLFDHVNLVSQRLLRESSASPNKYAAILPEFAPYQYTRETGGLWVKAYGNFEKIGMTQGLNVGNNAYGTLIGADLPVVDLKNGWSFLPTAYIGYNGAHQTFDYVGMYQNGGQGGFMGTFMKNDFIGSVLAYAGGYANEMNVAGFTDTNGNWFAGTAAKAAYNFHPSKNFIIQPTLLASYNYFGRQTWHTDFGDMGMRTGMLNGINIAPGVNFIYGRETWSIYATIQYMYNIMGYVGGKAGNVDLEGIKMRHGYIEYGLGVTKTWKDRLDGYLQITFRNGGRTGIGFQGGMTFRF